MIKQIQKQPHKNQKYQNKKAFKLRYHDYQEKQGKNAPLDHLCQRCLDKLKWRIQFGKYKSISQLKKCSNCLEKSINKAYRTICDKCSNEKQICAKCQQQYKIQESQQSLNNKNAKLRQMENYMSKLKERSKKKILRLIEKEEIDWDGDQFVDINSKQPIDNIQLKKKYQEQENNLENFSINVQQEFEKSSSEYNDESESDN